MRHATDPALDVLEPLLARVRTLPRVRERRRGTFYAGGIAVLHFHEDPAGLFADVKSAGRWKRLPADGSADWEAILEALQATP